MNVYDTANRLAYEIQESEEYKEYKKLKDSALDAYNYQKQIYQQ